MNRISTAHLPELSLLPCLQVLDLSGNELSTLADLPFMPSLRCFHVSNNSIVSIFGLEDSVSNLEILDISGNPLTAADSGGILDADLDKDPFIRNQVQTLQSLAKLEELGMQQKSNKITEHR
jgi:Leucine-rich repeat (LRR) protein